MPDLVKLNAAIDSFEASALGGNKSGDLSNERSLAIEAFAGKNIEPAPEGRSQVIDWTVFETIQWVLPSLTRIFANGDNVVELSPFGPEDEGAAKQETDYLNYLITQKNNWFLTCLTWFQDALLTKNAYCMAFMEEKIKTEKQVYKEQSDQALALLLQDGAEVVEADTYPDPNAQPQMTQDPMTGMPVQMPPPNLHDVVIRKTTPSKRLAFKVLPPENVLVGEDTPDFTTENCNYFEYFEDVTISDLRCLGFEIEDDIASDRGNSDTVEDARSQYNEDLDKGESPDPSMRIVRARTIFIRHDYDEDGMAELQKVVRVGREILTREEVDRIPVASIVPFINTHRHMGASVADLTFDIQRIKTVLLRGGLDSLYLSQNPRHAVSDKVNMDDVLVSRPGGVVRMKDGSLPSEGHIMPLTTEFTLPQTLQGLQHMDTVVESRVGVNKLFQGIDENATNDHNRIGQLSTMAAQRVEQIARVFSNGVGHLFSLAHELIIKSGHQAETIQLRGQWVTIDPSTWRNGRDMKVVAPFAAGNKDTLVARLMNIATMQEKALAGGLPIITPDDAYNTAIELTKASDFPSPEKFWTNPEQIPPPEPPPDYTMMALEVENKKADSQAKNVEVDAEIDKYKADLEASVDKYRADLTAETQIALAQLKEGQQANIERLKASLKIADNAIGLETGNGQVVPVGNAFDALTATLGETMNKLDQTINTLTAEKEIVRDAQGKVVGTKLKAVQ